MVKINRFSFWRTALGGAAGLAAGMPGIGLGMFAIFPVIWGAASSRQNAFAIALAYYLASSRGVFTGAPVFFGDEGAFRLSGLLLWLDTAISLAAPWGILFCRNGSPRQKLHQFLLILVTVAMPPLGFWGWSHPLLAAGYLLPGLGVFGLALLVIFWSYMFIRGNSTDIVCACFAVAILSAYNATSEPIAASADWYGARTSFGRMYSGSDETLGIYERARTLKRIIGETEAKYVALPETVAGWWGEAAEELWSDTTESFRRDGRTYFIGAEIWESETRYRNVIQIRGANNATFAQRYPVPVSMWRPWSKRGAMPDFFATGVVDLDGMKVGILICYEPYIFLPCIITMMCKPDVLLVPSNSWWARDTHLPEYSNQCVASWSRLFGVPAVLAKNL